MVKRCRSGLPQGRLSAGGQIRVRSASGLDTSIYQVLMPEATGREKEVKSGETEFIESFDREPRQLCESFLELTVGLRG